MPKKLELGECYSGDELLEILEADEEESSRYTAAVGKDKAVILCDAGNDVYEVVAIVDRDW